MAKSISPCAPKSSIPSMNEAMGQLTTPQKSETSPIAAARPGFKPSRLPIVHPKVAPIKKVATISPPLKPAPMVTAVNKILSTKASGRVVLRIACSI